MKPENIHKQITDNITLLHALRLCSGDSECCTNFEKCPLVDELECGCCINLLLKFAADEIEKQQKPAHMTSESLSAFLTLLREAEMEYVSALTTMTDSDAATQDLLHFLELQDPSPNELVIVGERIMNIRQARRAAKDRVEVIGPVVDWIEANRTAVKSLERLLGEMRKIESRHASRFYTPRTDAWNGLREPASDD